MRDNVKRLQSQQSEGSQRNIDKDGIFLTENFGGLNKESSSMNMPLADSAELMNVTVETSGKLRKRYGSRFINDTAIGLVDQLIPIGLKDGSTIFVCLGDSVLSVLADEYDGATVLYSKNVYPSGVAGQHRNTSYTTFVYRDFTYIYFARAGSPPILLQICQLLTSHTGTSVTIAYDDTANRDTTVLTNSKFKDVNGDWLDFASITPGVSATLSTTPTPVANGSGIYLMFNWRWVGEAELRIKEHIQDSLLWIHSNRATDTRMELSSRFKQHNFAMKSYAERDRNGQHYLAAPSPRYGCGGTCVQNVTTEAPVGGAPFQMLTDPLPQINPTDCSLVWWITGGQYVKPGAWSSVSGNAPSGDRSWLYLSGQTHLQTGGIRTTDAAYSVPVAPGVLNVYSNTYLPFQGGKGVEQPYLFISTNNYAQYTVTYNSTAFQTTGFYARLFYVASDAAGNYTTVVPDTTTRGTWVGFQAGSSFGIVGSAALFVNSSKYGKSYFGSDATDGIYNGRIPGTTTKDGIWSPHWGLCRYMNYDTGSFASVVGTFQNRLVFSGFASNPGVLAFSNVGTSDETEFGMMNCALPNRSFDVVLSDPDLATSPVELTLNMEAGEYITCMQQWYDDLFVGTNRNIYRIHGGDNIAITPSNILASQVANIGTITNGMVLTEDGIYFLGESGVYKIYLDINTGAYKVQNAGLKIRPEIRKGMDRGRFNDNVGRIAYDSVANRVYVLVGDEHGSSAPRRCFVYFVDREAWSEYSTVSGYMEAWAVASLDGRVFMGLIGSSSTYTTFAEFEYEGFFTDLIKTVTLSDSSDVGYDLDQPLQQYSRSDYKAGDDVIVQLSDIKLTPITDYQFNESVVSGATAGTAGTDYKRRKNNQLLVDGTSFWTGVETLTVGLYQEEDNPYTLNVYSDTDEDWLTTADLDYTDLMNVQVKVGSGYDGEGGVISLSYPSWWVSPAFTRNNLANYKRAKHFYAIFENEGLVLNNTYTAPSWEASHDFNVSLIQNGTLEGQQTFAQPFTASDLSATSPAWLDYYRVAYPLKGNFMSFQAGIHSFNRGTWEFVGYQIDTDSEGRTSRRAYNE